MIQLKNFILHNFCSYEIVLSELFTLITVDPNIDPEKKIVHQEISNINDKKIGRNFTF